ncbi:MAG: OadG family protein [Bacteroidales bacterium]|nr:OadG family protein [Bacteroidales bacterium]
MGNILLIVNTTWNETFALVGICFSIVLIIMAIFVLIISLFGLSSKKKDKPAVVETPKATATAKSSAIDDADYAAIATALHLYFGGEHDKESNVLTIKNISQDYSPWLNN